MGQAESLSISGGDGHRYWMSINSKPMKRGAKKTIYKAHLVGQGPRHGEKVVAKSFTEIEGTKEAWTHEVTKADITKQMVRKYYEAVTSAPKIRVVIPGIVEMDKASKFGNWRQGREGHRGISDDEWISIEELIPGYLLRYCPWSISTHPENDGHSDDMQTFSHFSYMYSRENLVVCDFQGVVKDRDNNHSKTLYIVTDTIIHSRHKLYGGFDCGEYGITEFFKLHKCTDICKNWPRPTPLTPPPPFNEACAALFLSNITPPPTFENIVFPAYQSEEAQTNEENSFFNRKRSRSTRRHRPSNASSSLGVPLDDSIGRRRSYSDASQSLAAFLMQRDSITSNDSGEQLSPPPSYESAVQQSCEDLRTLDVSSHTAAGPSSSNMPTAALIHGSTANGISTKLGNPLSTNVTETTNQHRMITKCYSDPNKRQAVSRPQNNSTDFPAATNQICPSITVTRDPSHHGVLRHVRSTEDYGSPSAAHTMRRVVTDLSVHTVDQNETFGDEPPRMRHVSSDLLRRRMNSERDSSGDRLVTFELPPLCVVPTAPPMESDASSIDET